MYSVWNSSTQERGVLSLVPLERKFRLPGPALPRSLFPLL